MAVVVLAGCGGGSGPLIDFAANHDRHPIAGKWFSGLTISGTGGAQLTRFDCFAWIGRPSYEQLPARARSVYVPGTHHLAKGVCAWKIPKSAAGKWLHGCADGYVAKGAEECDAFENLPVWRIRRTP
jgi:hypothetical protein